MTVTETRPLLPLASRGARGGKRRHHRTSIMVRIIILGVVAVIMMGPFVIMVSTSLEPNTTLLPNPPHFFPQDFTFANYVNAWTTGGFGRSFLNSAYVSIVATFFVVLISALTAFAFARFDFRGKNMVYSMLLGCLMIPSVIMIVPQYLLAKQLGMIDSLNGLIFFYVAGGVGFTTFMLRAFFERVPFELDEAMTIDGASVTRKFFTLYLPMTRPALATAAVFSFLGTWDEFVWALTVIQNPENRTLPVAIMSYQGQYTTAWGLIFAASVIATVPVVLVYIFGQRHFIAGISAGAVK